MKRFPLYLSFLLILTCAKDSTEDKSSVYITPPSDTSNTSPTVTKYTLSVSAGEGGKVSSEGGEYEEGTEVTITAIPNEGYEFQRWSDGSTQESITISIDKDINISANFIKVYELYKESYFNQRSGIAFTWSDYDKNAIYLTSLIHSDTVGWYGNGQSYHDVNNDGYQDILLNPHKDENNSWFEWYINQGDNRTFIANNSYIIESTLGYTSHKFIKTDVNNDENADFIAFGVDERIPGNFTGNFTVLINNGATFEVKNIPNPNRFWFHNGTAGDLNSDNFVDVVAADWIWWGDGNGNFIKSDIPIYQYMDSPLVYEILDYNQDGFNDLIIATKYRHDLTTVVYGSQGWLNPNVEKLPQLSEIYTNIMDIEIYDLDNDGDLDIVELRNSEETENRPYDSANSMLLSSTNINLDASKDGYETNGERDKYGWSVFKFDDMDNDGIDDIVSENYQDGSYNGLKLIGNFWTKWIFE